MPPSRRPCVPLVARGVGKRYGGAVALAGVDLDVRPGTVVGLVGPNGSGKTTLLHAVAGLLGVDAGIDRASRAPAARGRRGRRGARARRAGGIRRAHRRRARLARARALACGPSGPRSRRRAADGVRARPAPRPTARDALPRAPPAGERCRRLSLAPPLVLVDEATATLDPEAVVVLGEAVAALAARGCGVLLATQDLHFAGAVCDELVLLHRGVVLDRGEPGALRARHEAASLEEAFLAALGDGRLRERVRGELDAL